MATLPAYLQNWITNKYGHYIPPSATTNPNHTNNNTNKLTTGASKPEERKNCPPGSLIEKGSATTEMGRVNQEGCGVDTSTGHLKCAHHTASSEKSGTRTQSNTKNSSKPR